MIHWIFELTINVLEALIFYYLISHCLTFRQEFVWKWLCIIGDFAIVTICNLFIDSTTVSICINLLARVILTFLLTEGNVSGKLFWGCSASVVFLISENFVFFICKLIAGNDVDMILNATSFRYGACSIYILLSAILAFVAVKVKIQDLLFPVPALIALTLLILVGILAMQTLLININRLENEVASVSSLTHSLYFVWFSFWAIWILLFLLLAYLGVLYKRSLSLMEANEQQKLERAQYESLQSSNNVLRAWKHDNTNHLQAISLMIEQQEYQQCEAYIHQLLERIDIDTQDIHTGNCAVDAILTVKKLEAYEAGIDFTYELYLPETAQLPLTDIQISSLLGNLMNNAVEAATHVQNAYIHLEMKPAQSDHLLITVENSSTGNYKYDAGHYLLSTKDKIDHGIGLKQITRTVEKAGGLLKLQPEPDRFIVSIILPLKSEGGGYHESLYSGR